MEGWEAKSHSSPPGPLRAEAGRGLNGTAASPGEEKDWP